MTTKTTGAEIKRFYADPAFWPEDGPGLGCGWPHPHRRNGESTGCMDGASWGSD